MNSQKKQFDFKRISCIDGVIWRDFENFCINSQPYDFCSIPSPSFRRMKIKEYAMELESSCEIFWVEKDGSVEFFVAIQQRNGEAYVYFIFGHPFTLQSIFQSFRHFYYQENPEVGKFYSTVVRKTKKDLYIRVLQKRDPSLQIKIDKDEIITYWLRDNEK